MTIRHRAPSPALKPFVRRFMFVESESGETSSILPDTSLILGFRFKGSGLQLSKYGDLDLPKAAVVGLRDNARKLLHAEGVATALVSFTATGAASFLREPLHNLFNESAPLDALSSVSTVEDIWDRLAGSSDDAHRAGILEDFLLTQLNGLDPDPAVLEALAEIKASKGLVRIEELARITCLSQSALERRFRRAVGSSPKKFASIVRLRHVIDQQAKGFNLGDIAQEAGYYDQSHFVKDFKAFTGTSPESFFKSDEFC